MLRHWVIVGILSGTVLSGCMGGKDETPPGPIEPPFADFGEPTLADLLADRNYRPDSCGLTPGPRRVPASPPVAKASSPTMVTIRTDEYGVSHLYAPDAYSLMYANGYVQARDRLFQMDILRHVGYGDSASVAGPGQLASDMAVRRDLYTRDEIAQQLAGAPAALRGMLQAYSDGVNRFLAEATARDAMPGEFAAVGHTPEPWKPEDSVAVANFLIGRFGSGGGEELDNARRLATLERSLGNRSAAFDALGDLAWVRVTDGLTTISPADKIVEGCEVRLGLEEVPAQQIEYAMKAPNAKSFGIPEKYGGGLAATDRASADGVLQGFHWGSNALLVAGNKSATGQPVMFGGPQTGYFKPPVFYQVGLHGGGFDVVGVGVAGAPGVVIGRTTNFAWTVTSGIDDQTDTVVLELDPQNPRAYQWDGATKPMQCRMEEHRIVPSAANRGPPEIVNQEVCRAEGMPIIAISEKDRLAWAQRSTTRGKEMPAAWMWLSLGRQTSLQGFRDALASFPYTFNFFYAGPEGIAYFHMGNLPIRDATLDPRLPGLPGSVHAWTGDVAGLELGTFIENPKTGYVANWNNAPALGWTRGDQSQLWGSVHRAQVLDRFVRERLNATDEKLAAVDMAGILRLAATHDSLAAHTAPHFIAAAREAGDAALSPLGDALQEWADAGYPWRDDDQNGKYDDPGHAIWDQARLALQDRVFRDELGALMPKLVFEPKNASDPHAGDHGQHNNKEVTLVDALNGRTVHAWCDNVTTPKEESCREMLVEALREAQANLSARFKTEDVSQWLLPQHRSRFTPIGGSNADEIAMMNRGSWNQIVAIGQGVDQSLSVLPPGNSGLLTAAELAQVVSTAGPEPKRLTAELGLYTAFKYKPLPWLMDDVRKVATRTEELVVP